MENNSGNWKVGLSFFSFFFFLFLSFSLYYFLFIIYYLLFINILIPKYDVPFSFFNWSRWRGIAGEMECTVFPLHDGQKGWFLISSSSLHGASPKVILD